MFQENVALIKEINDLRRELRIARSQVHDLEAAMGLHRKSNAPGHHTEVMQQIMKQNKNAQMEQDLKEKEKVIELQQHEIIKLRGDVTQLEQGASRPNTGQRLQPVSPV